MDKFFVPLGHLPRSFPGPPPVATIGFIPEKSECLDRIFDSFNFSFILKGGGFYHLEGFETEVVAPYVITQWPSRRASYGPSGRWQTWQELYVVYSSEYLPELQRRNLARLDKPAWSIQRTGAWREPLDTLFQILRRPNHHKEPDRIDRLCEQLFFESASGEQKAPPSREEDLVRTVQARLKAQLPAVHDFDAIARSLGVAPITFRRYWSKYVDEPPARYVTSLRVQEAQRLLLQTVRSVADIARGLGFDDPLYFSRVFRKQTGLTASEYRRHFHPAGLERNPPDLR